MKLHDIKKRQNPWYIKDFDVLWNSMKLMYGDGGNRTRVQKLQHLSVYACILPI